MKKLQILGMGCKKCVLLTAHAEAAAKELGIDYEIEKITDINTIIDMGVMAGLLTQDPLYQYQCLV